MTKWLDHLANAYWIELVYDAVVTLMVVLPLSALACKAYFWLTGWLQ